MNSRLACPACGCSSSRWLPAWAEGEAAICLACGYSTSPEPPAPAGPGVIELRRPESGVYLCHFEKPLEHAQHYIGYAHDVERRVRQHQRGTSGVHLIRAVVKKGIKIVLVRTWPRQGPRFEHFLKEQYKSARALCPVCQAARRQRQSEQQRRRRQARVEISALQERRAA